LSARRSQSSERLGATRLALSASLQRMYDRQRSGKPSWSVGMLGYRYSR